MSHEVRVIRAEPDFLTLLGIRPWEIDLLTFDQFERCEKYAAQLRAERAK